MDRKLIGRPPLPPGERKVPICFTLDPKLVRLLDEKARGQAEGNRSAIVSRALESALAS